LSIYSACIEYLRFIVSKDAVIKFRAKYIHIEK